MPVPLYSPTGTKHSAKAGSQKQDFFSTSLTSDMNFATCRSVDGTDRKIRFNHVFFAGMQVVVGDAISVFAGVGSLGPALPHATLRRRISFHDPGECIKTPFSYIQFISGISSIFLKIIPSQMPISDRGIIQDTIGFL